MKNPAVSIIVPVYKVEKYINRCIDSILAQTFNDFELILVDDGSPDNSGAICDECAKKDSRIKVIHKQNGGVSSARNAGIKVAQGEFINFIDSDDTIPVDSLENLINLQKQNDADFVCCGFDMYSENSFIKTFPFVNKYIDFSKIKDDDARVFLSNLFRGPCAKLYKNNIVQKNNMLFDENVHIGEDTIFVYDYLSRCKNVRCGDIVVYNYLRNDQSATAKACDKYAEYTIEVSKSQVGFFEILPVDHLPIRNIIINTLLFNIETTSTHYLSHYSYKKLKFAISDIIYNFKCYFNKNDKCINKFLLFIDKKHLIKVYKILTSKNGVEKYCKYKLRQKRINDFKIKLKQIKIINGLNNLIKGRK